MHHFASHVQSFFRIVTEAHLYEQVGETHDAKADAPGLPAHLGNLGDGVIVHVDHVVQHMDRDIDGLVQTFPVHDRVAIGDGHHAGDVDGRQIAGLVGQQGLLTARVGAFDLTQLGVGVVPVDQVQEYQSWIAGLPGHFGYGFEQFFGVELAGDLPVSRVDQIEFLIGFDPLHEVFINGNRYIEVGQVLPVFLGLYELLHIGMVYVQDAHVGAAAGPALFHHVGGGVKGADEADRAAGDAAGGTDNVALRPEPAEGEPGASPAFVDQRGLLNLVEDGV